LPNKSINFIQKIINKTIVVELLSSENYDWSKQNPICGLRLHAIMQQPSAVVY